jgi:hypothetical protein
MSVEDYCLDKREREREREREKKRGERERREKSREVDDSDRPTTISLQCKKKNEMKLSSDRSDDINQADYKEERGKEKKSRRREEGESQIERGSLANELDLARLDQVC